MPGRTYHKENTLIGAGECYIALLGADGTYENERYLGDSPGASMSVETGEIDVDSSDGPAGKSLLRAVTSRKYSFSLTLGDISPENLQLFTGGTLEDQGADAVAETDEIHQLQEDRWIQLGQSKDLPGGHKLAADATITTIKYWDSKADAVTGTGGTDVPVAYSSADLTTAKVLVERKFGRMYVPRGSTLKGKWVSVDYTPATPAAKRVKVKETKALNGAFRYVEHDDPQGVAKPRNYYARLCSIKGDGQNDLKSREGPQRLALMVGVMDPGGDYPLLSIDGQAQS